MSVITGNGTVQTGLGGALGLGETQLPRGDAGSVAIDTSSVFENGFAFGGANFAANQLFISIDGMVSFGAAITGLPASFGTIIPPFVAPFMADIDTRLDGEGLESGTVWVDVDAVTDVVTITWADVGFYRRNATLTNTFQVQLFDQGADGFDIVLRYQQIDWVSGDLEGGWGGLDGTPASIGYHLGGGTVTLAASGNQTAQLALPNSIGNTGVAGMWVYHIPLTEAANDSHGGTAGNDTLLATNAAETLFGGAGFDVVSFADAPGAVTLDFAAPAQNTGAAFGDIYTDVEGAIGTAFDDWFNGSAGNDHLNGGAGDDMLAGKNGDDTLLGGSGDNRLYGGVGNDLLLCSSGADILFGGAGADTLNGGAGLDWASYENAGTGVTVDFITLSAARGDALGDVFVAIEGISGSSFADVLAGDNNDNHIMGNSGKDSVSGRGGDDDLHGGSSADSLYGGTGDDTLDGGSGADYFNGGTGLDWISYASALAGVQVYLAAPSRNTHDALGDRWTGIEGVIGSAFADTLIGGSAADRLSCGGGADWAAAGSGNDSLYGGSGNDTLDGGAGRDHFYGGGGLNWASYASARSGLTASLKSSAVNTADALGDQFDGIQCLSGSAYADRFYGDAGANKLAGSGGKDQLFGAAEADSLYGGTGDDTLYGGAGADYFSGGSGTDWARYTDAAMGILLDLDSAARSTGDAMGDTFLSIERVATTRFGDMVLGDAGANYIQAGDGNDMLNGRGGNDSLFGGAGNDTLDGGAGSDALYGGAGRDWITYASAAQGLRVDLEALDLNTGDARGDRLSAIQGVIGTQYQDILQGTLAADALNGDAGSDLLQGRGGNDRLFGGAGIDTIEGGNHHDTLYAGSGNDWAYGGKGDDHIYGGDGDDSMVGLQNNDSIYSGDGADRLFGGDGNDMLFGGGGDDFLFGGLGADLFGHSGLTSAGTDMIYDYSATGGDSLYLTLAGAGPDQIGLTLEQRNIGGVTAPYVVVTHLPTGQVLWMLAATIPITDLDIKIGATVYDLL